VGALIVIVLTIAFLDSLNQSTIVPGVVLGLGERAAIRVAAFTAGVFAVSTAGGLVLLFAFGRTFVARIAHPTGHTRSILELGVGIVLLAASAGLWARRDRLRRTLMHPRPKGPLVLGAGIMAIELPTAFPYFAAVLAILGAVHGSVGRVLLVVLYNVVFVAPLLGVVALAMLSGPKHEGQIERLFDLVTRRGPIVLPIGLAVIGSGLAAVGAARLLGLS